MMEIIKTVSASKMPANNLQVLCDKLGISQRQLAMLLQKSYSHISMAGRNNRKIAEKLQPIIWVLEEVAAKLPAEKPTGSVTPLASDVTKRQIRILELKAEKVDWQLQLWQTKLNRLQQCLQWLPGYANNEILNNFGLQQMTAALLLRQTQQAERALRNSIHKKNAKLAGMLAEIAALQLAP